MFVIKFTKLLDINSLLRNKNDMSFYRTENYIKDAYLHIKNNYGNVGFYSAFLLHEDTFSVTATSVRNRPAKYLSFFIYGRREKQKGKEKQDLSKRQRKDGLKHRYTGRTLNENREAGFDCTAEQTLRVSYKQHKGKLNA